MEENKTYIPELVAGIRAIYQEGLLRIVLYGSVARGTNTAESDVDVAVIVENETVPQHEELLDFVTDMDLKYDTVFSVLTIQSDNFQKWEKTLPFYKNIVSEGIELWTAA